MPRRARLRLAGSPFHVIQRGINRSNCFGSDDDRQFYLQLIGQHCRRHGVALHAYVLMSNHTHLLMTPKDADGLGLAMKAVSQQYVQHFNRRYERLGTLWTGRFRSFLVDSEEYLLCCHAYIEMNPVRAGLVWHPGEYAWSSYPANAMGVWNPLLTVHPCIEALGRTGEHRRAAYRLLFEREFPPAVLERLKRPKRGPRPVAKVCP